MARPLRFGRHHWNLTANGEGYLGGGAFLRPRDLLKVGQAYLDGGVWHGRRSPRRKTTAPRIEISEATTGYSAEEFGNYYGHAWDALAWHLSALNSERADGARLYGRRQWRPDPAGRAGL